jgi:hypothetical protein
VCEFLKSAEIAGSERYSPEFAGIRIVTDNARGPMHR